MKKEINLQWHFNKPVQIIWESFTALEKIKQWKGQQVKPEVGYKWMEEQKPRRGWDGKMYFEVLEIIPNKKISYSFKGGPNPNEMNLNTIVNWQFEETESGTTITLNHTGFEGFRGAVTRFIMEKGWGKIIGTRFKNYLDNFESKE